MIPVLLDGHQEFLGILLFSVQKHCTGVLVERMEIFVPCISKCMKDSKKKLHTFPKGLFIKIPSGKVSKFLYKDVSKVSQGYQNCLAQTSCVKYS
jgi:hypothetical protein